MRLRSCTTTEFQQRTEMTQYLFLYGTLLPHLAPGEIAPAVQKLRWVGEASVHGTLYHLGTHPGAIPDPAVGSEIHGTIFELPEDERVLGELDDYEEFDSGNEAASPFVRRLQPVTLVTGEVLPCWIYVYNREPGGAPRIPSGRYSGH
jgi:gamma-glutamylcyclotransferase (GGCT)/AIG2-like uncharacterized protein YtfP